MSSQHLRGDTNYAWPTAEVAVMGAKVSFMCILVDFCYFLYKWIFIGWFNSYNISINVCYFRVPYKLSFEARIPKKLVRIVKAEIQDRFKLTVVRDERRHDCQNIFKK